MSFGAWFAIVWGVLVVVAIGSLVFRHRRESPTRQLVLGEPVLFATRAAVLINGWKSGGAGWVALKGAGWPEFRVHSGGLEATIGAFDGLVTGTTMLIKGAAMRRERLSIWPLVSGDRDCIRLWGTDGNHSLEWKVSPRGDSSIDELWMHLVSAGVRPTV
jgi:hypothetical protein